MRLRRVRYGQVKGWRVRGCKGAPVTEPPAAAHPGDQERGRAPQPDVRRVNRPAAPGVASRWDVRPISQRVYYLSSMFGQNLSRSHSNDRSK